VARRKVGPAEDGDDARWMTERGDLGKQRRRDRLGLSQPVR
jgi:hypothetical protein